MGIDRYRCWITPYLAECRVVDQQVQHGQGVGVSAIVIVTTSQHHTREAQQSRAEP